MGEPLLQGRSFIDIKARTCLAEFRERYNRRRPHWAVRPELGGDPLVPEEVYAAGQLVQLPRWQQWAKAAKKKLDEMMGAAQGVG